MLGGALSADRQHQPRRREHGVDAARAHAGAGSSRSRGSSVLVVAAEGSSIRVADGEPSGIGTSGIRYSTSSPMGTAAARRQGSTGRRFGSPARRLRSEARSQPAVTGVLVPSGATSDNVAIAVSIAVAAATSRSSISPTTSRSSGRGTGPGPAARAGRSTGLGAGSDRYRAPAGPGCPPAFLNGQSAVGSQRQLGETARRGQVSAGHATGLRRAARSAPAGRPECRSVPPFEPVVESRPAPRHGGSPTARSVRTRRACRCAHGLLVRCCQAVNVEGRCKGTFCQSQPR